MDEGLIGLHKSWLQGAVPFHPRPSAKPGFDVAIFVPKKNFFLQQSVTNVTLLSDRSAVRNSDSSPPPQQPDACLRSGNESTSAPHRMDVFTIAGAAVDRCSGRPGSPRTLALTEPAGRRMGAPMGPSVSVRPCRRPTAARIDDHLPARYPATMGSDDIQRPRSRRSRSNPTTDPVGAPPPGCR